MATKGGWGVVKTECINDVNNILIAQCEINLVMTELCEIVMNKE